MLAPVYLYLLPCCRTLCLCLRSYDLAFLTETWLRDYQSSNAFAMSGYNFFRRDRSKDLHGGVCIYIKDSIKYEVIDDLFDERLEAIWSLPRGMSSIVISTIYHPQTDKGVSDTEMLNYLYESMTVIGDFNRLNTQGFTNAFKLKQIVHFPTRGTRTLDCIFTNLSEYYTAVQRLVSRIICRLNSNPWLDSIKQRQSGASFPGICEPLIRPH